MATMPLLQFGDENDSVKRMQRLLRDDWDYTIDPTGTFGAETRRAVKQFQSTHHDEHGAPLVVDGKVGDLTWWALTHRRAARPEPDVPRMAGGSAIGRKALRVAIAELEAGAGEEGGNNSGRWVRKYHAPVGVDEGEPWCASFVSWSFLGACGGDQAKMPFRYSAGARNIFMACRGRGWEASDPEPGDLITWWRESLHSGKGHIGIVESVANGFVFTVEGNKTPKVARFQYVRGRIDQLIGFVRVP